MRRLLNIAFITAFVGLNAWMLFNSSAHFAERPRDGFIVLGIALAGGVIAHLASLLPPEKRARAQYHMYVGLAAVWMLLCAIGTLFLFKILNIMQPLYPLSSEEIAGLVAAVVLFPGGVALWAGSWVIRLRAFRKNQPGDVAPFS